MALTLLAACTTAPSAEPAQETDRTATSGSEQDEQAEPPTTRSAEVEPVPYVPAGQPGTSDDYAALVDKLEEWVPTRLQSQVPWPDLRNPNPINAQIEIFELWIWMAATLTEPILVEIMAAPDSPSRQEVTALFGRLQNSGRFQQRNAEPYQAFDHRVVTFQSAGLPLWLGRDVPDDAVVVYYRDRSGAVTVTDQETGEILAIDPATEVRTWLSIMVPTDVGWQLWRDQILDQSNSLEFPDVPPPPGTNDSERLPEV